MLIWLGKWFLYVILRLLSKTCQFVVLNEQYQKRAKAKDPSQSYILAFWHEQLLAPLFALEGQKHCGLASQSGDGKIIGFICKKFGNPPPVFGSQNRDGKDKGGLRALMRLLAELRDRGPIAITIDGSIGPRRIAKAGVIDLARKAGVRILPVVGVYSHSWRLKTWDQFQIPKPFSKIIINFGSPITVPPNIKKNEVGTFQKELEEALQDQERQARDQFLTGKAKRL